MSKESTWDEQSAAESQLAAPDSSMAGRQARHGRGAFLERVVLCIFYICIIPMVICMAGLWLFVMAQCIYLIYLFYYYLFQWLWRALIFIGDFSHVLVASVF